MREGKRVRSETLRIEHLLETRTIALLFLLFEYHCCLLVDALPDRLYYNLDISVSVRLTQCIPCPLAPVVSVGICM